MNVNWSEVLTIVVATVVSAVLVGGGGALWVAFSKRGKAFWAKLGTVDYEEPGVLEPHTTTRVIKLQGVRTVFFVAVVALATALGTSVAFVLHERQITPPLPSPAPENIVAYGSVSDLVNPPALTLVSVKTGVKLVRSSSGIFTFTFDAARTANPIVIATTTGIAGQRTTLAFPQVREADKTHFQIQTIENGSPANTGFFFIVFDGAP